MRILFFGDIMGRSGRDGLATHLPDLKKRLKPDVIIVNAENAAAGFGVT
ncbi:YmdB family metallophosphoesterase, partial [Klebsiella pneumoniae]